jgi:hypothetical protein
MALLPKNGKGISTVDLVAGFYGHRAPYYARQIIVGRMTTLIEKLGHHPEMRIYKSARRGPHPIEYWLKYL